MTTFADVLPVEQLSANTYSANFQHEWCIGTVPNGGYVTSAFMLVASKHMQITHPKRKQKHVINLHLEFLRKTEIGQAIFAVREIKIGSRISNLQITLSQKDEGKDAPVDKVEGYFTMTAMDSEEGVTLDSGYKPLPRPLPVSFEGLVEGKDANYTRRGRDPLAHIRRAALQTQMYVLHPQRRPTDFPKAMMDLWVRFAPSGKVGRHTNDELGFVVDIFPQLVETYVNPDLEEATIDQNLTEEEAKALVDSKKPRKGFWYPTLNLNLDVKKALPAEGVEWLFVRVQANKIQNGRFDLNVTVLNEEGDLVATSSHASLAVDISRNTSRSKNTKSSKI